MFTRRNDHAADTALVSLLFRQHGRAMLAYALRLTGNPGQAEDRVRDALLRAWRDPRVVIAEKAGTRLRLFALLKELCPQPDSVPIARCAAASAPSASTESSNTARGL